MKIAKGSTGNRCCLSVFKKRRELGEKLLLLGRVLAMTWAGIALVVFSQARSQRIRRPWIQEARTYRRNNLAVNQGVGSGNATSHAVRYRCSARAIELSCNQLVRQCKETIAYDLLIEDTAELEVRVVCGSERQVVHTPDIGVIAEHAAFGPVCLPVALGQSATLITAIAATACERRAKV